MNVKPIPFIIAIALIYGAATSSASKTKSSKLVEFKHCKVSESSFKISDILISPNPPVIGRVVTATVRGVATKEIRSGSKVKVKTRVGIFPLPRLTIDLCKEGADYGLKCPIAKGEKVDLKLEIPVVEYIPGFVRASVHVEGLHADGALIFCSDVTLGFRKPGKDDREDKEQRSAEIKVDEAAEELEDDA